MTGAKTGDVMSEIVQENDLVVSLVSGDGWSVDGGDCGMMELFSTIDFMVY